MRQARLALLLRLCGIGNIHSNLLQNDLCLLEILSSIKC
jgi:hypothetical protein